MLDDAGSEMKARLRADLRATMKDRKPLESRVLRSLVAALDNAEAPEVPSGQAASQEHQFEDRSAEVERLLLTSTQVRDVLLDELKERERAAATFDRLGNLDHAADLREEASAIRRYLG